TCCMRRLRAAAKWACTAIAVLALVAFAVSSRYNWTWPKASNGVTIDRGGLLVILQGPRPEIDFDRADLLGMPTWVVQDFKFGFHRGWHWTDFGLRHWPSPLGVAITTPIWAVFVSAMAPALALWMRDSRV